MRPCNHVIAFEISKVHHCLNLINVESMSANSGPFLFSYNSKNTLNRLIFDSNKRRKEGLENSSSAQPASNPTRKRSAPSSLSGRKTPLQTRVSQNSFCPDADEVQHIREFQFPLSSLPDGLDPTVTSSPMQSVNDAYMRQNESILVSSGGRDTLQAGRHVTDELLASPPAESVEMVRRLAVVSTPLTCTILNFLDF